MLSYFSLIITYLRYRIFHSDFLMVGAECNVRWEWEQVFETRIISFAPEPVDNSPFDDYGWSDEAFAYLDGFAALLRFIRYGQRKGHEFASVRLIYAEVAE